MARSTRASGSSNANIGGWVMMVIGHQGHLCTFHNFPNGCDKDQLIYPEASPFFPICWFRVVGSAN